MKATTTMKKSVLHTILLLLIFTFTTTALYAGDLTELEESDEFSGPDYFDKTTTPATKKSNWIAEALNMDQKQVNNASANDAEVPAQNSDTADGEEGNVEYYYMPTTGFYFSVDGRFELPVRVADFGAITGIGGGGSLEAGVHFAAGWRLGLHYVFAMNMPGSDVNATDISMMHNMVVFQVAKEFDASTIDALPSWLIIAPSVGAGVDFINGSYVYRSNGETYQYGAPAFMANAGLSLEVDTMTVAVPYIGATADMYFDVSGFVPYIGVTVGVRFDWGRIRSVEE